MNETTRMELEQQVVELGDAKEVTMGVPAQVREEENQVAPYKFDV